MGRRLKPRLDDLAAAKSPYGDWEESETLEGLHLPPVRIAHGRPPPQSEQASQERGARPGGLGVLVDLSPGPFPRKEEVLRIAAALGLVATAERDRRLWLARMGAMAGGR
jgi:hypothetical protein